MARPLPKKQPIVRVAASTMLGERISRRRKSLKLTVSALATRASLTGDLIKRIEAGVVAKPDLFEIAAIAPALGCTLDQLLHGIPTNDTDLMLVLCSRRPAVVQDLQLGIPVPTEEEDDEPIAMLRKQSLASDYSVQIHNQTKHYRHHLISEVEPYR